MQNLGEILMWQAPKGRQAISKNSNYRTDFPCTKCTCPIEFLPC